MPIPGQSIYGGEGLPGMRVGVDAPDEQRANAATGPRAAPAASPESVQISWLGVVIVLVAMRIVWELGES